MTATEWRSRLSAAGPGYSCVCGGAKGTLAHSVAQALDYPCLGVVVNLDHQGEPDCVTLYPREAGGDVEVIRWDRIAFEYGPAY